MNYQIILIKLLLTIKRIIIFDIIVVKLSSSYSEKVDKEQ